MIEGNIVQYANYIIRKYVRQKEIERGWEIEKIKPHQQLNKIEWPVCKLSVACRTWTAVNRGEYTYLEDMVAFPLNLKGMQSACVYSIKHGWMNGRG